MKKEGAATQRRTPSSMDEPVGAKLRARLQVVRRAALRMGREGRGAPGRWPVPFAMIDGQGWPS